MVHLYHTVKRSLITHILLINERSTAFLVLNSSLGTILVRNNTHNTYHIIMVNLPLSISPHDGGGRHGFDPGRGAVRRYRRLAHIPSAYYLVQQYVVVSLNLSESVVRERHVYTVRFWHGKRTGKIGVDYYLDLNIKSNLVFKIRCVFYAFIRKIFYYGPLLLCTC